MPLSSGFLRGGLLSYALRLRRRPAIAYPVLAVAIAAATLARWFVEGHVVASPFVTYYPIIIIAALLGGFWIGLASIACSALLGWYLFLPAASPFVVDNLSAASILVFVMLSLFDVAIAAIVNKAVIRLSEQEKNVRSLVEALPNGVMVVTRQGLIANVNAAVERIFGYPRSELIGASTSILVPDRFRRKHDTGLAAYLANPRPLGLGPNRQFKGRRRDGSEVSVEVGFTPIERYGETAIVVTVIDISERIRAEDHEKLLARELQHRTQNLFSVIQAIVARTLVSDHSVETAKRELSGRLNALAGTYAILAHASWEGVSLADIIQRELREIAPNAVTITGCDIVVNAGAAQQFALIVHELATNAFKYGALSDPGGRVTVAGLTSETAQGKQFSLVWTEHGGPPVSKPTRKGFGSSILLEAARQFGMAVDADFRPDGLAYSLTVAFEDIEPPVAHLVPSDEAIAYHSVLPS